MPSHNTFSPDYSVSKAALNRGVQLLAADGALRPPAAAVAAVCPGWCRTGEGRWRAWLALSGDGARRAPATPLDAAWNGSPAHANPPRPRQPPANPLQKPNRADMGTAAADRSAEQGAASILAPWERAVKDGAAAVNGTFTRDGEVIDW
jgi:hypothetical protein